MSTWTSDTPPPAPAIPARAVPKVGLRLVSLALLLGLGLALHALLRLIERSLAGAGGPLSAGLTQAVCRLALRIMGLRLQVMGTPLRGHGALVANHASWLDIFALNAATQVVFVSKAEVARWPGIGWLARATGTVFIRRDKRDAAAQTALLRARLAAGHRLLFFPEGTSSDGLRVLPFKTTLFEAFLDPSLREGLRLQPVSLRYTAPVGADPRALAWWGDMDFAAHLLRVLALPRGARVQIAFHEPHVVAEYPDRKTLARACEVAVQKGFACAGAQATP